MQLEHSFSVPVGVDDAWQVLLDIERIAPCMPGAAIESVDGDDFTGSVKVKLGPINLTYKGKASFVEKDETAHRAVIDARGRDARGNGTAAAKITAVLSESGGSTTVQVNTDLDITGKPAQFGRGVMVDVGNKLIGQFADCLAGQLGAGAGAGTAAMAPAAEAAPAAGTAPAEPAPPAASEAAAEAGAEPVATAPAAPAAAATEPRSEPTGSVNGRPVAAPQREVEPINLLESAGPAVAKRLAPVAVGVVVLLIALRRRSRHRHG
ncbi:MAG TPA: SRPBCC family protein [Jatrophihabitans sp.]|nr:SRPBCC family protein [Jatrophihabitans sp.]